MIDTTHLMHIADELNKGVSELSKLLQYMNTQTFYSSCYNNKTRQAAQTILLNSLYVIRYDMENKINFIIKEDEKNE